MDGGFVFGPHHGRQIGELVEFRLEGRLCLPDAVTLHERMAAVIEEHGRCFLLCDLTTASTVQPEARRYMSEWNKTRGATAVATFGANFAMRAVATLIVNAIHLLGSNRVEIVFLRDEAEARQWLATRRVAA